MTTSLKPEPDSKSDAPPSYKAITAESTISLELPKPLQSKWSWMLSNKKRARATVLSCIRDLVTTKKITPSSESVTQIANACAAALPRAEFLNLLQSLNIEGHTPLYWAILSGRLEVFRAFTKFISIWSYICASDLRLACMATNNHALFMQMDLRRYIGPDDAPLRRSLDYPPDDVKVQLEEGDVLNGHKFVVLFRFKMCQKRLCILKDVSTEFVAAGRIWWFRIYMGPQGKWRAEMGLSEHSLPACPDVIFLIEARGGTSVHRSIRLDFKMERSGYKLLAPEKNSITGIKWTDGFIFGLGDWLMDPNCVYMDSDGTLEVKLDVTLL